QELERFVFKSQDQPGKMPRFPVKETVGKGAGGEDIAGPVKDPAGAHMLKNARARIGQGRSGKDVEFFFDPNDFVQASAPFRKSSAMCSPAHIGRSIRRGTLEPCGRRKTAVRKHGGTRSGSDSLPFSGPSRPRPHPLR